MGTGILFSNLSFLPSLGLTVLSFDSKIKVTIEMNNKTRMWKKLPARTGRKIGLIKVNV
jgi:hypothetical protein